MIMRALEILIMALKTLAVFGLVSVLILVCALGVLVLGLKLGRKDD